MRCPACGRQEFEKRGEQRTYHPLGPDLKEEGWTGGELTLDTDDDGKDVIYCCGCDSEFSEDELRGQTEGGAE